MNRRLQTLLQLRPWQRHSLVLTIGGVAVGVYGWTFLSMDRVSPSRFISLRVALNILPLHVWGWIFVLAGLAAVLSARWPTFSDSWGYAVIVGLSSGWSTVMFLGYFFGDAPVTNVSSGLTWALLAFMFWAISGLDNPAPRDRELTNDPD